MPLKFEGLHSLCAAEGYAELGRFADALVGVHKTHELTRSEEPSDFAPALGLARDSEIL